jgi:hypothetical protein
MIRQCASTAYLPEIEARGGRSCDEDRFRLPNSRIDANSLRGGVYIGGLNTLFAASRASSAAMKALLFYGLDADANNRP